MAKRTGLVHGSYNAYRNYGCRCDVCRAGCAKRRNEFRAANRAPEVTGPRPQIEQDRFWAKVDRTEDCWTWTAGTNGVGYGLFYLPGDQKIYAHRWSYIHAYGSIPAGLRIDHRCRNRSCVRPDHLEVVTHAENIFRGAGWSGRHYRGTCDPPSCPVCIERRQTLPAALT